MILSAIVVALETYPETALLYSILTCCDMRKDFQWERFPIC